MGHFASYTFPQYLLQSSGALVCQTPGASKAAID